MRQLKKMDKTLMILLIIYCIFGIVMIFSASSASTVLRYGFSSSHFFIRQLIVVIVGFIAGLYIMTTPLKRHKSLIYVFFIAIILLLIYVLIKGKISHNAKSWIDLKGFSLQPSEFAKSLIVLFMAYFYQFISKTKSLGVYFIPMAFVGVITLLTILQPDFGSAIILFLMAVLTFLYVPFIKKNKNKVYKILLILGVIILILGYFKMDDIFTSEKISRLTEFSNPCERYEEHSGYQVCNGYIAIANGGLFGLGLGQSTQKYLYLPESHTDFIFPIICEECGAILGALIIIGYGVILFKILNIARNSVNIRNRIIAYGTFWYLTLHVLINLLGILAIIPLTGVPLPFLSYGGSFTLNAIIMVCFTERAAIENKIEKINQELKNL